MVRRTVSKIFKIFDREIKGVHQAALLLGFMGILTKILALLRDKILAAQFGAGRELDIYFSSFRIPDFIFTMTLFITASASLIPFFLKEAEKSEEKARIFLGRIFIIFSVLISVILIAAFFLTPYILKFITPGFSDSEIQTMLILTRIMLLSPLFLGLSNVSSIVIQSFQKFFIYALSPLLYNAGIILGVAVLYPRFGINGLAYGVAAGAALHFFVQIPSILKLKYLPKFSLKIFTPEIKKPFFIGFFRTLGLTLNQIVFIILTAFASLFPVGSISVFNFSNNLQSIPLTVIGLSYSVAVFPVLSRYVVLNRKEDFLENVSSAARHIIFWSIPLSVIFIVLRAQIVRVVLGAGVFGWTETRLTAASLAIFSVSITAQCLILLFSRAYYAAEKTKRPLLINIFSSFCIVATALVFLFLLKDSNIIGDFFSRIMRVYGFNLKILSLPAAYSIGSLVNAFLLWKFFKRDFGAIDGQFKKSLSENLIAGVILGLVSYLGLRIFIFVFNIHTFFGIFFQGFFAVLVGVVAHFFALRFLKNKEIKEITASLKTKFWKTPVISDNEERFN